MKVAEHAKLQAQFSRFATKRPEGYAVISPVSWEKLLGPGRALYYRLLPDHSVEPIVGEDHAATLEWAREFEKSERHLAKTYVEGRMISTIFLGLDHGLPYGAPLLFETMAFTETTQVHPSSGREYHEELQQRRYATYDEAMRGHDEVVAEIKAFVASGVMERKA